MKHENLKSKTSFRKLLQQELLKRCEKNPRYSLRAFAKTLQVSHATLSHLIAGRRPLTSKMIQALGKSLNLSFEDLKLYMDNVSELKNQQPETSTYHELTADTFTVISEWYYDAIAELTHLKSFKGDIKWIAKVLGISVTEVNIAVERLQRLELLEITKAGKWIDLSKNNSTALDPDFTTAALKKYQKKILELSAIALDEIPKSEREHVSNTIAIQKSDVVEVKKKINSFRFRLSQYLQRKDVNPNEVYQLAISFFPITKKDKL